MGFHSNHFHSTHFHSAHFHSGHFHSGHFTPSIFTQPIFTRPIFTLGVLNKKGFGGGLCYMRGRKVSPSLSVAVTWHKNHWKQEVTIYQPAMPLNVTWHSIFRQFGVGVWVSAFICSGSVIDTFDTTWTTMSCVNRGFRDERCVICDVWCVRCLNTLNTALASVTLAYNHTALWQFITLGNLITGIRHTPTAEIQMDKITNV